MLTSRGPILQFGNTQKSFELVTEACNIEGGWRIANVRVMTWAGKPTDVSYEKGGTIGVQSI